MKPNTQLKPYYTKLDHCDEIIAFICAIPSTAVMLAAILLPLYIMVRH